MFVVNAENSPDNYWLQTAYVSAIILSYGTVHQLPPSACHFHEDPSPLSERNQAVQSSLVWHNGREEKKKLLRSEQSSCPMETAFIEEKR